MNQIGTLDEVINGAKTTNSTNGSAYDKIAKVAGLTLLNVENHERRLLIIANLPLFNKMTANIS